MESDKETDKAGVSCDVCSVTVPSGKDLAGDLGQVDDNSGDCHVTRPILILSRWRSSPVH